MGTLSLWHWLIVLVIVVLVFGTKKLRNIGEDLGGAVRGFKQGLKDGSDEPADQVPPGKISGGPTVDADAREKRKD